MANKTILMNSIRQILRLDTQGTSKKKISSLNESFADFAEHYSTVVLPARAYRSKDKALVEGMVKIVYRTIYTLVNHDMHTSLVSLNTAIREAPSRY